MSQGLPSVGCTQQRCTSGGAQRRWVHKRAARGQGRGAQTATDELLLDEFYSSLLRLFELGILVPHFLLKHGEREGLAAPLRVLRPKVATALGVVLWRGVGLDDKLPLGRRGHTRDAIGRVKWLLRVLAGAVLRLHCFEQRALDHERSADDPLEACGAA